MSSQGQTAQCHRQIFQTHLKIDHDSTKCFINHKCQVLASAFKNQRERASFLSHQSASPFSSHTGKKAEIQFSPLIAPAVKCNAVTAYGLYLLFVAHNFQCPLRCSFSAVGSTRHISKSFPITFLSGNIGLSTCIYTVQKAPFSGDCSGLKTKKSSHQVNASSSYLRNYVHIGRMCTSRLSKARLTHGMQNTAVLIYLLKWQLFVIQTKVTFE